MAEEVRFFLRIGLFAGFIGVVYWFLSYEIAGSVMLVALFAGASFFMLAMVVLGHAARPERRPEGRAGQRGPLAWLDRVVGFDEPAEETTRSSLELAEDVVPPASIWPLLVALASALVGLGLLFGGWLWVPGVALALLSAAGWITQLEP